MRLTAQQVTELIGTPPSGSRRGRLEAHRRAMDTAAAQRSSTYSAAQHRLVAALIAEETAGPATPYAHPMRDRAAQPRPTFRPDPAGGRPQRIIERTPLTSADVAWLSGLPEPDRISYRDAVALAGLAARTAPGSSDELLVDRVWAPVKLRHDRAEAEATRDHARSTLPPSVPRDVARQALAEAIAGETDQLTDDERSTRVERLIDEADTARSAQHDGVIEQATERLAALDQEFADRERLTA